MQICFQVTDCRGEPNSVCKLWWLQIRRLFVSIPIYFFLACANTQNVTFTTSAAHLPPRKWKNTVPKSKCTRASVWRLLGWMFYYVFLQPSQCLFCPVGHRFGDATIMLLLINSSQTKALSRCTVKKNISLSTLLWMAQHRQERKNL